MSHYLALGICWSSKDKGEVPRVRSSGILRPLPPARDATDFNPWVYLKALKAAAERTLPLTEDRSGTSRFQSTALAHYSLLMSRRSSNPWRATDDRRSLTSRAMRFASNPILRRSPPLVLDTSKPQK
jgi:hypothetical protein